MGIRRLHLPEEKPTHLRAILAAEAPDGATPIVALAETPPPVRSAAERIAALTRGADDDLADLPLDDAHQSDFARQISAALRTVPPGDTITYGELARRAGHHGSHLPRAVGQVLGRNPFGIIVPCHRVVAASGRIGGFSAHGGVVTKLRLLRAEARGEAAPSMPYDLAAARRDLKRADADLARLIEVIGERIPRQRVAASTVAALAESITAQQVSTAAAASIFARLSTLFPRPLDGPTARGIAALTDAELRGAGLSRSKVASLRDLSDRALAGLIPDLDELAERDDEAIVRTLTPIRGVGRWTVEMLLIFRLGRPDVLPVDDLGVRNGFARMLGRPLGSTSVDELRERGEAWRPWRSVASWYLWRAGELS